MCGICGFIDYKSTGNEKVLSDMVSELNHRGPDDSGQELFLTGEATVGIGHTRLSILDLSEAGHQPMLYRNLVIALNGEIYNFKEIRAELHAAGHVFVSDSDTEVVLHAFARWGEKSISKFIGMFAFVIYDREKEELYMVRDRAGVKPLYYYRDGGLFLFASELKAFHKHPRFRARISKPAVHQYFDFGYIPSPHCIFENCHKLEPGHILHLKIGRQEQTIREYWNVRHPYYQPSLKISYPEARQEMEQLLVSAFNYRMVADVPVGIFLSGGYDSTAVASVLQSTSTQKLKTFTIGFEEGNNEAPFARQIAQHLGTDHTEYYCTKKEALAIIPDLPYYYDEPFGDSSAIPTILVSSLARKSVTVALSADAGDEIFAGYDDYRTFLSNLSVINKIPVFSRSILSHLLDAGSSVWKTGFLNHKMRVLSSVLRYKEHFVPQHLLRSYYSLNKHVRNRLFTQPWPEHIPSIYDQDFSLYKDHLSSALATDYQMYLQNDILAKVDRATMSVSLEGREPFLDHRIVEFAARLPTEFKFGTTQKKILKDIVYRYVPQSLMERPKSGFAVPVGSWLRNDLRWILEENLSYDAVSRSDLFNPEYVEQLKQEFLKGKIFDEAMIWKLIQFQMWYKRWKPE